MADDFTTNLAPFAYEGVEFPGDDVSTGFGHDSAKHQGYGMRGADIETTGPKPVSVTLRAVLKNGLRGWTGPTLFPTQYARLLRALETRPEGYLTHPTRGLMSVHVDDVKEALNSRERRGVELTIAVTEQRGESELLDFAPTSTAPDAAMESAAAEVDALAPAGAAPITPRVNDVLTYLDASPRTYLDTASRLTALVSTIEAADLAIAAAPASTHAYRAALRSLLASTLAYRDRYSRGLRTVVVPVEMSLARVAALREVYGDPRRAAELLRANAISDPSRIPAGTRLTVVG